MRALRARLESDYGASLVEYALLLVFIAVVAVLVVTAVGGSTSEAFSQMNDGFP